MRDQTKTFYITTPIFYPNNILHLGHAYTMVIADCIARYKQLDGYMVYLQTGSDEHGEKIVKTSLDNKTTPQKLINRNIENFKKLWSELNIKEYYFVRTSNDQHKKKVQQIFNFLLEKGDIYLGKYQGSYCFICEEYVLNNEKHKNCSGQLVEISEEAYFLKTEKYRSLLIEYYQKKEDFLLPKSAFNELSHSFLQKEIPDLCITRKSLNWGILVPEKPEMTIYVWFEALLNYLTSEQGAIFFSSSTKKETEIVHIIGKDIIRFHGIYWMLMLFSLKKKLPDKIIAHGWIINSGSKMSKSKGNVINPLSLIEKYGSDVLRVYLCSKITLYQDGILNEKLLTVFYEEFFVKKLSNLLARTSRMFELYNQSIVPNFKKPTNYSLILYFEKCSKIVKEYKKKMNLYSLTMAFSKIQEIIDLINKFISELSPWKVFAKADYQLLGEILNALANGIRILTFLLMPFAPNLTKEITFKFGINCCKTNFDLVNLLNFSSVDGQKIERNVKLFFK